MKASRKHVALIVAVAFAVVVYWGLGQWLAARDPIAALFTREYVTLIVVPVIVVLRLGLVFALPATVAYVVVERVLGRLGRQG